MHNINSVKNERNGRVHDMMDFNNLAILDPCTLHPSYSHLNWKLLDPPHKDNAELALGFCSSLFLYLKSEVEQSLIMKTEIPTLVNPTTISSIVNNSSSHRKLCKVEECHKYARCRGYCTVHGGRHYCKKELCTKVAQVKGLCSAHGGVKPCAVQDCKRAVQSKGYCKTHGGGVRCHFEGCSKSSISKGLCRAHGGGTKCCFGNCDKWAQKQGFCWRHFQESKATRIPV